jgi:hypothetical protein
LLFWSSPWMVNGPARPKGTCANPTRFSILMVWAVFCVLPPEMLGMVDTGDVDAAFCLVCLVSVLVLVLAVVSFKEDSVEDMVLVEMLGSLNKAGDGFGSSRFMVGCSHEFIPR